MAEGNITKIYSRGTRDATSKWGIIKVDGEEYEFHEKHLDPVLKKKEGLDKYTADKMDGWLVEFDLLNGEIQKGTLKRK